MKQPLHITLFIILYSVGMLQSCDKFIAIDAPKSELVSETIFEYEGTAHAAMTSVFASFVSDQMTFILPFRTGLYGDELYFNVPWVGDFNLAFEANNLDPVTYTPNQFWNNLYKYIYQANAVMEGVNSSKNLSSSTKKLLIGESLFMRSYCHFLLTNLYGDVPIVLTTDYRDNMKIARSSHENVYAQIINDLLEAQEHLTAEYVNGVGKAGTTERVRPNKFAAKALLARVFLYQKDFTNAIAYATDVINQVSLYDTVSIDKVFLRNNREAIWQLPPSASNATYNTQEGRNFILAFPTNGVLSKFLIRDFADGDLRFTNWAGTNQFDGETLYLPYKYKITGGTPLLEYSTPLRLAEMYLIRSEAQALLDNLSGALDDLNIIKQRAGLPKMNSGNKQEMLLAILAERRIEFFCEYGHRWFDLKRIGLADEVMNVIANEKGIVWNPYKKNWPIAQTEIDRNPNMKQNDGYDNIIQSAN